VDDDLLVLTVTAEILRRARCDVLSAISAREALTQCSTYTEPIHLALVDVVMPDMYGLKFGRVACGRSHPAFGLATCRNIATRRWWNPCKHLYLATVFLTCPMTDSKSVVVIGIIISYKKACQAQVCTIILESGLSSECRQNPNGCFDFPRSVRSWSTLMCP
jgi:hypothetical protein